MPHNRTLPIVALLSIVFALGPVPGLAHQGAEGIVKSRMVAMETIGKSMKSLALIVQQKVPYSADEVRSHALILKQHSGKSLTDLFPQNSLQKPTAALPTIWQDWMGFTKLSDQLSEAAATLAAISGTENPPLKDAFKAIAKTCSSCHKSFRQKK